MEKLSKLSKLAEALEVISISAQVTNHSIVGKMCVAGQSQRKIARPAGKLAGTSIWTGCMFCALQSGRLAIFTYLCERRGRSTS